MTGERLLREKRALRRLLADVFGRGGAGPGTGFKRALAGHRAELERLLDEELLPQVEATLSSARGAHDPEELTRGAFSALTRFFARYAEGAPVPSPPCEGGPQGEVTLHYADADRYYVKTTEQHAGAAAPRFTKKRASDHFIHKDLGASLRRALDAFIKDELLRLDDLDSGATLEAALQQAKVIRAVGDRIITWLAQNEDLKKHLYLKRKFVLSADYLVALRDVPEALREEVLMNGRQRAEWRALYGTDEREDPSPELVVDTSHFDRAFKYALLSSLDDVDGRLVGRALSGDNFHALSLLRARFEGRVNSVYIDPPYNTGASKLLYRNGYARSTWLAMMSERLRLAAPLVEDAGILCVAIDDEQVAELRLLMRSRWPRELGVAAVRSNPQSRKSRGKLSPAHEYALFYGKSERAQPGTLELTDKRAARYPHEDALGRFAWMNFRRTGNADKRADRPKMFYPIVVAEDGALRVPEMIWSDERQEYVLGEALAAGEVAVYPIAHEGGRRIEKRWHRGYESVIARPEEYRSRIGKNGEIAIDFKARMDASSPPPTWWDRNEYASSNHGAAALKRLFGENPFDFPKAPALVADCLRASGLRPDGVVLDVFAGSGTTADVVIDLNRADGGRRSFVLVEEGDHFDTVVVPRIKKTMAFPAWSDGRPTARDANDAAAARTVAKIARLESYDDALEAVTLDRREDRVGRRDAPPESDHQLRYTLDRRAGEARLSVDRFRNPWSYTIKTHRDGVARDTPVDLVETFNYFIGLRVERYATFGEDGLLFVLGTDPGGRRVLVVWRDCERFPNGVLEGKWPEALEALGASGIDLVYVNGDELPTLRTGGEAWELSVTEETFHARMFGTSDIE